MSKVYYDQHGISVTDTVFITPVGDQYPIRNITSVAIRSIENKALLYIGIVLSLLGLYINYANSAFAQSPPAAYYSTNSVSTFSMPGILILIAGLVCILIWHFTKKTALVLGAGGIIQTAISYPLNNTEGLLIMREVSSAINQSISNLQNT